MTDFDIISGTGIAIISSYVTAVVLGETTPRINEYGEKEYSIPGYLLLSSSYILKWVIASAIKPFKEQTSEENADIEPSEEYPANANELIV